MQLPAVPCRSVLSPLQRSAQVAGRTQLAGGGKLHLQSMPSGKGLSRFALTQQDKGMYQAAWDQVPRAGCSEAAAAWAESYNSLHRGAQWLLCLCSSHNSIECVRRDRNGAARAGAQQCRPGAGTEDLLPAQALE